MPLLIIAFFGLIVGDGLFLYWLINEYQGVGAILQDHLLLAFMFDLLLTLVILTVYFARNPPGPVRWPWFVVFALVGGVCFALPFFWWINRRRSAAPLATRVST